MNNLSLYRIIYYHLPHALRMPKTLAWLKLSLTYLQMVILRLDEEFLEARRLAWMTPQVCYIEKYLRVHFGDNTIRLIEVSDIELYAFLAGEVSGIVQDFIVRVISDGGTVETGADGTHTYIANMVAALGGNPQTNDLYLTDEGTIMYTSAKLDLAKFVVQVSLAVYNQFSQSIMETVRKFRLPAVKFIFQIVS